MSHNFDMNAVGICFHVIKKNPKATYDNIKKKTCTKIPNKIHRLEQRSSQQHN